MNNILQKKSREMSYLLRHEPEDLKIDKNGYVLVTDLLKKLNISLQDLDEIVSDNDKKRFAFNTSKDMIRASQGHSIKVDLQLKATRPPRVLYHGTTDENYQKIKKTGIDKVKRLQVHLSDDYKTAYSVGKRYSKNKEPLILEIDSAKMNTDGFKFLKSANDVWMTDNVPAKYIRVPEISDITGYPKCKDCDNDKLNGWSSHCKSCGMPIVY
jgi:putative RNA 2'-phosphotransferase